MSKIRILSLEDYLRHYYISETYALKQKQGKETEIGSVITNLEEKIDRDEKKEILKLVTQDEEMNWLEANQLLGDFGEEVALNYFESIYSKVSLVSSQASLGYDIQISEDEIIGIEVKTAKSNNAFHITYNELNTAFKLKDKYLLFFIKVNELEDEVLGYLIQNPIKSLKIDFFKIIEKNETQMVSLIPNKFYVSFQKEFLQAMTPIELNNYIIF